MFFDIFDRLIISLDSSLKTLTGHVHGTGRGYPVKDSEHVEPISAPLQRELSIQQMRINHTGEVCAQALYHSQMLFCTDQKVSSWLLHAAQEEQDHLLWCDRRLSELGGSPSIFNPFFYLSSYAMGAVLSMTSTELNLGFIRATENLVCEHLTRQLEILSYDLSSRQIIEQMIVDENTHSQGAEQYGGVSYSPFSYELMRMNASCMKVAVSCL